MLRRMRHALRSVVSRRLRCPLTAEAALRALAERAYPAMLPTGRGPMIVAADPDEVVTSTAVWDALDIPCSSHPTHPTQFAGGWMGLLADPLIDSLEAIPAAPPDPDGPSAATLGRYPTIAVIDADGQVTLASVHGERALDDLERRLVRASEHPDSADDQATLPPPTIQSSLPAPDYRRAVGRIRDLIRAGDCYQVNLTQRLTAPWTHSPSAFASRLWKHAGPSSHRGFLDTGRGVVVSASPELLVRVRAGHAESEPIKGTARIGDWPTLRASVKDRAEHVMIVDLVRNDLGRVARPGCVRVPRLFARLSTPYVEHMVSTVTACLADGTTASDVLRAVFPGGSVTGTPKVRSLEVIRDLEPVSRGPAFGSLVAVAPTGDIEASVAIRTAWLTGSEVRYWCGGAVVWDSDPQAEFTESMAKATPFLTAIGAV